MDVTKMKAIGTVRNVDSLGRVVLPKDLRRQLGIETNTPMEIFAYTEGIFLRVYKNRCVFCGEYTNDKSLNQAVCEKCIGTLKEG